MREIFLVCGLLLLISGEACTPSHLGPQQFVKWVEDTDNGLAKIREIGNYRFVLQYQPKTYMNLKYNGLESVSHSFESFVDPSIEDNDEKDDLVYFELSIGSKDRKTPLLRQGISDMFSYQERVNYLSYEQEKHIYIISEDKSIQPVLFHFERSFDLHSDVKCSIAFKQIPKQNFSFVLDDFHFGIGPIYFSFNVADFQQIPALNQ